MRTRVEEKIRIVVERMERLTYVFEDLTGANLKLDSSALPAFVNVMPLTGSIRITPTQIKDFPNCSFWFVDKVRMDEDADGIQDVVERCKDYAYEFLLLLNRSRFFEPVENTDVSLQVVTGDFDANVCGVTISLQLRERTGLVLCNDKEPRDYFDGRCVECK